MSKKVKKILLITVILLVTLIYGVIRIQRERVGYVINAIRENDIQELSELLEGDIWLNMTEFGSPIIVDTRSNLTPLIIAVQKNNLEAVKMLIDAGADPNKEVRWFGTALHFAVHPWGDVDVEIVEYLISSGADVNYINDMERTPLSYMFTGTWFTTEELNEYDYNRLEKVKCLIESGATLEDCGGSDHILLDACFMNDLVVVKYLIEEQNVNVNIIKNGKTPLMKCTRVIKGVDSYMTLDEVCEYLLINGADYTIKDENGKTVYDLAVENDNYNIINLLNKYMDKNE